MSIRKWDPLGDLLELQERMNRLFEESITPHRQEALLPGGASWIPQADAYETAEAFVVQIELPGIDEESVEVQVAGDRVSVRGERRADAHGRPERFHRMERSYGAFARTFHLGEDVDAARVKAQLRDGVLRLDLPKARVRSGGRGRVERSE